MPLGTHVAYLGVPLGSTPTPMQTAFSRTFFAVLAAFLFSIVLFTGQSQAQDRSSSEVLNRVRTAYASTDALRAQFTQQVGGSTMEGTLTLHGDQYRIETADQILVTDGRTAWAYSKTDNQVLVSEATEDATAFSPSTFFTRYPDQFNVTVRGTETLNGTRHDVLRLTPKDGNTYVQEVTLYVRSADSLPARARVVDGNGTTMTFDLHNMERNPRISADTFRFSAPRGAEVVDLR